MAKSETTKKTGKAAGAARAGAVVKAAKSTRPMKPSDAGPAPKTRKSPAARSGKPKVKKPGPLTVEAYEKLSAILASQRRLGSYPLTVARLLELADMPWPGEAALANDAAARYFMTSTDKKTRPALDSALVFLREDLDRLASHSRTLRLLIERQTGGRAEACPMKALVKNCEAKFASTIEKQTRERVEERRLPPGIGALRVGKGDAEYLFVFEQIIGAPDLSVDGARAPVKGPPPASVSSTAGDGNGHSRPHSFQPNIAVPRDQVAPSSTIGSGAAPAPSDLATRLQAAFDRIDADTGRHNQVWLYDLRQKLGVSREEFDACLDWLRYGGVFTLAPDEGRFGSISPEKNDAGIPGPSGRLVYAARRDQ
jgi:hypothetical protein